MMRNGMNDAENAPEHVQKMPRDESVQMMFRQVSADA